MVGSMDRIAPKILNRLRKASAPSPFHPLDEASDPCPGGALAAGGGVPRGVGGPAPARRARAPGPRRGGTGCARRGECLLGAQRKIDSIRRGPNAIHVSELFRVLLKVFGVDLSLRRISKVRSCVRFFLSYGFDQRALG